MTTLLTMEIIWLMLIKIKRAAAKSARWHVKIMTVATTGLGRKIFIGAI